MLMDAFFDAMLEALGRIERAWATGDPAKRARLAEELAALRALNDRIVDRWLEVEEALSLLEGAVKGATHPAAQGAKAQAPPAAPHPGKAKGAHPANGIAPNGSPEEREGQQPWFRQGLGYFNLFMFDQAEACFRRAVAEHPDETVIRLFLACTLLYTGAWAEAAERFAELLRAPDAKIRAVSWNGLGCLAGMRGQYREARDCFRNALRCQDTPVVRYNLAVALLHSHSPAEAISLLEPLVREDPRDWDAALLLLRAYLRAGKRESAERLGSQLLAGQSPPAVLKQVAACLEANGLYGEAADCYRAALAYDRRDAEALHGLGWTLWLAGRPEGMGVLQKALSLTRHPDHHFSYAWVLLHSGDDRRAERVVRGILARHPDHVLGLSTLVILLMRRGERRKARVLCEKLLVQPTMAAQALGNYHAGHLALMDGAFAEAAGRFDRAVALDPTLVEGYVYQGLAHLLNDDVPGARRAWEQYLASVHGLGPSLAPPPA
ncbi:hypothetical protein JCM14719A_14530 [Calditerricola satsumensis]|uniref:Tetratricopeptide repeat protein n=4 Tax=Calditerricola satsumensis TaxID=373054 RepID=A0A8J3BC95_9BACI|nr:hypothetical protein GCM10007043_07770 [Calditerricola satsumensis]